MRKVRERIARASRSRIPGNFFAFFVAVSVTLPFTYGCHRDVPWTHDDVLENNCLANEKVMGMALNQYTQDNDGTIPNGMQWMDKLSPYAEPDKALQSNAQENVFQCPAFTSSAYGYAFNSDISQKKLSGIDANKSVFVYDSTAGKRNATDPMTSVPPEGHHSGMAQGMVNIGFADGHAKAIRVGHIKDTIETSTTPPPGDDW